ncbi:MAG: pantoate--beta-alanine ligase [Gammaproteobacteria bacterium]|jgi:pantoate--beta-alanine ligase|nr:pantoate--beta-alanine ligase [Gammaproteobacteria bacterium]
MNIITNLSEWQKIRASLSGKSIGFVPTMGHLHAGHLSLCQRAQAENDCSVVSIFINPTQFNQTQDFKQYPRTLEQDQGLLREQGIDYLLMPDFDAMYPDHYEIQVTETALSQELEGAARPGHFTGMLTVVLKLLNLSGATRAYFGEKDFQQILLVEKMVQALFLSVEIIRCPTVRAEDGLALSSRNSRLDARQRQKAAAFAALLHSSLSSEVIKTALEQQDIKVDYVTESWGRKLAAVWIDDIRLLDNIPGEGSC